MTNINYKDEIRKLAELQEMDKHIFVLNKEQAQHPALLAGLQKEFDDKKTKLKALEENKQKQILRQKDKEGELSTKEEAIKKSQGQLGQLKTNKEYQAKLSEIESLKADKSLIEEEILKLMDENDNLKKELETEKKALESEEKNYNEKKAQALNRLAEIQAQLANFMGKRKILISSIEKRILAKYEHILQGKDGLAIVKIQDNSCQGCFMKLPHQVINEIKMYDRLITCEVCSRILFLENEIQV